MTTLIIHTGGGKCGSSAIQKSLSCITNSSQYCSSIYFGPKNFSDHTRLLALINPKKYSSLRGKKPITVAVQSSYEYLDSLRKYSGIQYVVVSSEYFASQTNENLNKLVSLLSKYIQFSDVRVIQYVRTPDSLYLSSSQQRIKADSVIVPFYNFTCDYSRLGRLKNLHCDDVILREFSRSSLVDSDVVKDFFAVAFEGNISFNQRDLQQTTIANESLSSESLSALQVYNLKQISAGLTVSMGRHTRRIVRQLRSFDKDHAQRVNKAVLQPFMAKYLILNHMPALQKACQEYGLFKDLINKYNCTDSPTAIKSSNYSFNSRGSSFQDIRSILLTWDDQLADQALTLLSTIE